MDSIQHALLKLHLRRQFASVAPQLVRDAPEDVAKVMAETAQAALDRGGLLRRVLPEVAPDRLVGAGWALEDDGTKHFPEHRRMGQQTLGAHIADTVRLTSGELSDTYAWGRAHGALVGMLALQEDRGLIQVLETAAKFNSAEHTAPTFEIAYASSATRPAALTLVNRRDAERLPSLPGFTPALPDEVKMGTFGSCGTAVYLGVAEGFEEVVPMGTLIACKPYDAPAAGRWSTPVEGVYRGYHEGKFEHSWQFNTRLRMLYAGGVAVVRVVA